ncbi:MAG: hypothetical protein ACLUSL_13365 [Ruminococcus sp.]
MDSGLVLRPVRRISPRFRVDTRVLAEVDAVTAAAREGNQLVKASHPELTDGHQGSLPSTSSTWCYA